MSDDDAARAARVLDATPGLAGEPSHAERARTVVASATHGSLATIAAGGPAGYPYGSLVAYAADDDGRLYLSLSDLAEHASNLAADARASVLVAGPAEDGDPLAGPRVTLVGDVREVHADERRDALDRYRRVHPTAFWSGFADFRTYRLEPVAVRYVGGFGRMSWVAPSDYRAAEPDPLLPHAAGILTHMNDDHADALIAFCRVLGVHPETRAARMTGVDRYGFDVLATADAGDRALRFAFDATADTPAAVRAAMVDLVRRTR